MESKFLIIMLKYPFIPIPKYLLTTEGLENELINFKKPKPPIAPIPPKNGLLDKIFGNASYNNKLYLQELKLYDELLKRYRQSYINYENELNEFIIKSHLSNKELAKNKYQNFFSFNSDLIKKKFQNIEGISEQKFKHLLISFFGSAVITNISFEFPGYPDFLLFLKINDNQVIINIEIDEPYIAETGKPIHYLLDDGYGNLTYSDAERDDIFHGNGIIVIRFAEEQIVSQDVFCIWYIQALIHSLERFEFPYKRIYSFVPTKINRWNEKEAINFSNSDYRNKYLFKKIRTSQERGIFYQFEDFKGTWAVGKGNTKISFNSFSIQDYPLLIYFHNGSILYGLVTFEKDLINISVVKRKLKYRVDYRQFNIQFKILSYSNNKFYFLDVNHNKQFCAMRID
jgi:hypothetical protein